MTVADLITRFDYDTWATTRLLDTAARLPDGAFVATVGGAYGSVRTTAVHGLNASWGWLGRCGAPARGPRLDPADYPTVASVQALAAKVDGHARSLLASLTDADLDRVVVYRNDRDEPRSLPLGEILAHAANHAVHHRGQIAMMLRMLGQAPGNVDLLFYYGERRGVPVW